MSTMTPTKIATTGTYLSWKIFEDLRIRRGKLRTKMLIKHLRLRTKCVRSSYDKNLKVYNIRYFHANDSHRPI